MADLGRSQVESMRPRQEWLIYTTTVSIARAFWKHMLVSPKHPHMSRPRSTETQCHRLQAGFVITYHNTKALLERVTKLYRPRVASAYLLAAARVSPPPPA